MNEHAATIVAVLIAIAILWLLSKTIKVIFKFLLIIALVAVVIWLVPPIKEWVLQLF